MRFIPFIPLKVQTALKTPKADEAKLSNFQTEEKKGKTFYTTLLEYLGSNLKRKKKIASLQKEQKKLGTTEIVGKKLTVPPKGIKGPL